MDFIVISYSLYLPISIGMTIWVARTLHKNGRLFLVDSFGQNEALADSVNHLLVVGFYLINIGFISLFLRTTSEIDATRGVFEILSAKVGVVMLVLGVMHFLNLFVFSRLRRRALEGSNNVPPIAPNAYIS
jgi:hypothetical protein